MAFGLMLGVAIVSPVVGKAHAVVPPGPAQFAASGWTIDNPATGGDLIIRVLTLPSDGGSAITDLEYQIDGGAWVSLAGTTIGNYAIAGLTDDVEVDIAIRAVNAVGNGTASVAKQGTPTTALLTYSQYILADPTTVAYWPLDEAVGAATVVDDVSAFNATVISSGVGWILGQTGLIPSEADTAARLTTSGAARLGSNVLDNDGTLPSSMAIIMTPNILRSGATTFYNIFSKSSRVSPNPGWEWDLRWSSVTTTTTFDWQMTNDGSTNRLNSRSVPDISNALHHLGFSYAGTKLDSGLKFYVDGFDQTHTIIGNNLTLSPSNSVQPVIGARHDGTTGQFYAKDDREKLSYHNAVMPQWGFAELAAKAHERDLVADPTVHPVNIIIDSDLDTDADDAAAFGVAVVKQLDGRCIIRCATISSASLYSAGCAAALLEHGDTLAGSGTTFADIPVGARLDGADTGSDYAQDVCNAFGHVGDVRSNYTAAVTVLRTALAALADGAGVKLCVIGALTNISALMQSPGDGIDTRTGLVLMEDKGVVLHMQLFNFPGGAEYNALLDTTATDYVVNNWTGEIVITGYTLGNSVSGGPTGSSATNPYKMVYDQNSNVVAGKRKSWDSICVLNAIEGRADGLFEYHLHNGKVTSTVGVGAWTFGPESGHSAVTNNAAYATISTAMDVILAELTP